MKTDILIVGSGCSGLYAALHLPQDRHVTVISKSDLESNDSYLAQGGMCMLKDERDFDSYFEDTMKAGHYENDRTSVEIMIRSSQDVVKDLVRYGVRFARKEDGSFAYTREGAHSAKRILFHEDITGKEITSHILAEAKKRPNIELIEYTTMVDILEKDGICTGAVVRCPDGSLKAVYADYTILATGGIGGLFRHSTNFRHLTGDSLAVALRHHVALKNIDYIQIHPTTFYSRKKEDRSFLISESVRGEGARLYNKDMHRFVNELLPRDLLTEAIERQMKLDHTSHVWEDLRTIDPDELRTHFPNIVDHCIKMNYDPEKKCIPVVPAQHYFMGGIRVNHESRTSMDHLYAVGETACNGVHGRNRLASNSLLESLVFAKRAARDIAASYEALPVSDDSVDFTPYLDEEALAAEYRERVLEEIDRQRERTRIRDHYNHSQKIAL